MLIFSECSALNIVQIAKIKIPSQTPPKTFCKIISIRNDGAFLSFVYVPYPNQTTIESRIGICVKNDGSHIFFPVINNTETRETNLIERIVESGSTYRIQDEIVKYTSVQNTGTSILRSINNFGYLSEEFIYITQNSARFKVSEISKTFTGITSSTNITWSQITKFDKNGNATSVVKLPGYSSTAYLLSNFETSGNNIFSSDSDPNHKYIYSSSFEDGFAVFHKVIDEETLSPNRITLGASQNGSLTATVNNPEQALLNIQSSTNLIDWNTFKTIKNEPSLEIVVPANKPKEFIRAIE